MHAKDHRGRTPLHHACEQASLTELAKALLEKGADVHAKDNAERTLMPLHGACVHGHAEVAKALQEMRADVHAEGRDGLMPLYYALRRGRRKEGLIATLRGKGVHCRLRTRTRITD